MLMVLTRDDRMQTYPCKHNSQQQTVAQIHFKNDKITSNCQCVFCKICLAWSGLHPAADTNWFIMICSFKRASILDRFRTANSTRNPEFTPNPEQQFKNSIGRRVENPSTMPLHAKQRCVGHHSSTYASRAVMWSIAGPEVYWQMTS